MGFLSNVCDAAKVLLCAWMAWNHGRCWAWEMPFAVAENHAPSAPECVLDANDPFDLGARSTRGVEAGKCLKQDFRPAVVLSASEAIRLSVPQHPDRVLVANVAHSTDVEDVYTIASIPLGAVSEARLLVEHFEVIPSVRIFIDPGHIMLHVFFESDVELFSQVRGASTLVHKTRSLVFSFQGSTYFQQDIVKLPKYLDGSFALTGSVFSFAGRFQSHGIRNGFSIEQWRLRMASQPVSEFISRYLQKAETEALNEPYFLLFRNCSTEVFKILDEMFSYSDEQRRRIARTKELERVPSQSPWAFDARGLFDFHADKLSDISIGGGVLPVSE
jgi:hypothetical protein